MTQRNPCNIWTKLLTKAEVCPTSNVCLKVVDDYAAHPLPTLLAQGLYVTLNSDDPALFGTSLTAEYYQSHQWLGLSLATLTQLAQNALAASLLPPAQQAQLQARYFDARPRTVAGVAEKPFGGH